MSIEEMKKLMDKEFNYKMDFKNWDENKFINYLNDLMNGRTEFYLDEFFPKEVVNNFLADIFNTTTNKNKKALEKGGAQINIRLRDGKMIVRHTNQEGVLLHERNCFNGEWDELWEFIRRSD